MSQRKIALVAPAAFALALAAGTPALADDYGVTTPLVGSVAATTLPVDATVDSGRTVALAHPSTITLAKLAALTTGAAPTGHYVSGSCTFTGQLLDSTHILVEFTGSAVANGHTAAASTGVLCEVFNSGGYGASQAALPGNATVAPPQQVVLGLAAITVCVTSQATFIDNHNAVQTRTCR